jgi:hypothetical protein
METRDQVRDIEVVIAIVGLGVGVLSFWVGPSVYAETEMMVTACMHEYGNE